jgi:hypothetical protein
MQAPKRIQSVVEKKKSKSQHRVAWTNVQHQNKRNRKTNEKQTTVQKKQHDKTTTKKSHKSRREQKEKIDYRFIELSISIGNTFGPAG